MRDEKAIEEVLGEQELKRKKIERQASMLDEEVVDKSFEREFADLQFKVDDFLKDMEDDDEDFPVDGNNDGPVQVENMGFEFQDDTSLLFAFGCPERTLSACTIRAGTICFMGTNYSVASASVALSGSTEYVYVYHKKDHSGSGFGHASTYPTSGGDEWRVVLATYTSVDATIWDLVEINHAGDITIFGATA